MTMSDYHSTPYQPQRPPQTPPYLPVQRQPISQPFPQQQYPPPQPPQPPKQRARVVLLVACVLALAAAGVFGALYVAADSDRDAAVARLDERKSQLAEVRERLTAAKAEEESGESRNGDLEAEKTTLKTCVDAVQHYLWDGLEGTARETALDAMFTACQ